MDGIHYPPNPIANMDDEIRLDGDSSCRLTSICLQFRVHTPDFN